MSIQVKLSDYVDFLYHNACERRTTYVWCNDDGDLFVDNAYHDGCHRIGFADYRDELDEANITQYSDNADMAKMTLANAIMEGEGYPIIGETDDGEDIEIINH